ncbi:MAG TPA: TIGR01777 family oxidoreductase [Dongiaceae bacterium]|nr:TIGR01777 family oxidoreductase [Dongiaceae bacterium]
MSKIVLVGGTGQVGTILARHYHAAGDDVVVLSRSPKKAPWRTVAWDAKTLGPWTSELEHAAVVIGLAGRSVNCRYNAANRNAIMASRVDSTHAIGQAIAWSKSPPRTWLQMSTATIYAHRYDAPNDEATGIIGGNEPGAPPAWNFSIEVARAWERAVDEAATPQTRKVKLRSSVVLSPDRGGIFDTLLTLTRRGLGGTAGNGKQYVSWIHEADFVRAIEWIAAHDSLTDVVNVASPNPLPNADFMRDLRRASRTRIGLPTPKLLIAVGALFMRTEPELVLKSRRVIPAKLLDSDFEFTYPTWPQAALDLCARSRQRRWSDVAATGRRGVA